jgi:FkbM family methyltransferase
VQLRAALEMAKCMPNASNSGPPLLHAQSSERKHTQHGVRCSYHQIGQIASRKPIKHSNCPNTRAWTDVLLKETSSSSSVTVLSIGCNKGDDFVGQMKDWSGDERFSVQTYHKFVKQKFGTFSGRACTLSDASNFKVPKRTIRGYCVEPMPNNYKLIETSMQSLKYLGPVTLIQAAISSVPGVSMFPNAETGTESLGLGHAAPSGVALVLVNVTTIDEIVRAEKISSIEFLSIDTEGNDFRAILGGIRTLAAQMVRYLEFEYHAVGRWAASDLQDLIDLLDQLGFDCYWALNSGGLSRLTGCWHDSYYRDRFWSNIACVDRNLHQTHHKMNQLSGFA